AGLQHVRRERAQLVGFEHTSFSVPSSAQVKSSYRDCQRITAGDDYETSSVPVRYLLFPSEGSLFSESSNIPDVVQLHQINKRRRNELLKPQRSAISELWKPLRRSTLHFQDDVQTKSEPPHKVTRDSSNNTATTLDGSFEYRRHCKDTSCKPCHYLIGLSTGTKTKDCDRQDCCRVKLDSTKATSSSDKRRAKLSFSTRTTQGFDEVMARLEDPAACAKLSLSELRPVGQLRTSDMFVGQGGRGRYADAMEVAKNLTIWILVLCGTGTIMFGAIGTIIMRSVAFMFFSSVVGSTLTTLGILMAIYCTDASDRNFRLMNPKYNYT
ncbi:unnamed protein product, partial [Ixodes persulcatus]